MSVGSGIILILTPPENNQYQNILTRAELLLTSDLVTPTRDHHTPPPAATREMSRSITDLS